MTTRTIAALLLTVSTIAAADERADRRQQAAASFASAERAFGDEDYPEALRWFRAAFAATPDDTVRFNIAVCLERLGRFREASGEYAAAAASAVLADDVRARARIEADRVRARLGTLVVAGTPAGAAVRVDGLVLCQIPCTVALDPGRHEVLAEAALVTDRTVVEILRGETSRITLDAILARRARGPGPLTWVGGSVAALGIGATVVFGLRARSLHQDYLAHATAETRDEGLQMRDLTNVSIAIAAAGTVLLAVDLVVLARRARPPALHDRPRAAMIEIEF